MRNFNENIISPAPIVMPSRAVQKPIEQVINDLERVYGADLYRAFEYPDFTSPVQHLTSSNWLKRANTVGINVRTLGDFWTIIPYAMTLPKAQNAIHLLPVFEPGVVSSLYGPCSWNINPEFYSNELAKLFPHQNSVEKQLALVVRLLHLMGKAVGFDVIPHVDRFAEPVLANPSYFEWIQRKNMEIINHDADLHQLIQSKIHNYLQKRDDGLRETEHFDNPVTFFHELPESKRLKIMFGEVTDYEGRLKRRIELVNELYAEGYETLPATMGPPYRGIEVNPDPSAKIVDQDGREWRDYRIIHPEKFSRVFGPLTRFKLYEPIDNNKDWALDFQRPVKPVWEYVCEHYHRVASEFDFDFMRGDMSHVQMRPSGVPSEPDEYYDLLGAVKQKIAIEKPYFGYFAESFLAPPNEMAYGDECDHLEASGADTTLGNLQSEPIGTPAFIQELSQYAKWLNTRKFAPNFTLMTADKDDPRFDKFYLKGNETRYFLGLFIADFPSYMGMGFECRDPHPQAAPNEHYSKLYVFHMSEGPNATKGPYVWGENQNLYRSILRQQVLADTILPIIQHEKTDWLIPPDERGEKFLIVWTQQYDPKYVFAANLNQENTLLDLPFQFPEGNWQLIFSSREDRVEAEVPENEKWSLAPGECLVWEKI